jgi:hypothetical protein
MHTKCDHWGSHHATTAVSNRRLREFFARVQRRHATYLAQAFLFFAAALLSVTGFAATLNAQFSNGSLTLFLIGATPKTCPAGQPITEPSFCRDTTLVFTITGTPGELVSFTETLPSSLRVSNPLVKGGTCTNASANTTAAAGGTTIAVANVGVPAAGTCTVMVDVANVASARNGSCATNPTAFTTTTAAGPPPPRGTSRGRAPI